MNKRYVTIAIRIGNNVKVEWNPILRRWAHSDDSVSWQFLPANIQKADTAIEWAISYYGLG